jgi:hypothetical protein
VFPIKEEEAHAGAEGYRRTEERRGKKEDRQDAGAERNRRRGSLSDGQNVCCTDSHMGGRCKYIHACMYVQPPLTYVLHTNMFA